MPSITIPAFLRFAWFQPWMLWAALFVALEAGVLALVITRSWPAWVLAVLPVAIVVGAIVILVVVLSDPNTFR